MGFLNQLGKLLKDPPPAYLFELSEAGIAYARQNGMAQVGFQPIEPDILSVTPLHDNVLRPEALFEQVRAITPANGNGKRRRAALILPDFCARVTVLDFDSFPAVPEEQLSLVRFRVKKSVPFDIDSAAISYHVQPGSGGKRVEVVVVVAAREIVARYEAPFRAAGYHPGMVTVSSLMALHLAGSVPEAEGAPMVVAKLSGRVLTATVMESGKVRLVRCVELPEVNEVEVANILHPTFAFMEDELGTRPKHVVLCGFGSAGEAVSGLEPELGVPVQAARSRFGAPTAHNAGLLGYLESMDGA